jgi:hypothetical protein
VGEDNEVHGGGVDVESFMIEMHETEVGRVAVASQVMRNHTHGRACPIFCVGVRLGVRRGVALRSGSRTGGGRGPSL